MTDASNKKEKIIVIVGPTAGGKSSLALKLAERFDGEIISCDSMQLYRSMDIGTAKATKDEQKRIPHHMTDILDITDTYSVSDYVKQAYECADDILSRRKIPILCGGTGLYADSFINNTDFGEFENLPDIRNTLEELDSEEIYAKLSEVDSDSAEKLNISDRKRMIRALEVYYSTGRTITDWKKDSMKKGRKYDFLILGVNFSNRENLYERINLRVDKMLEDGILDEAKMLYERGLESTPTAGQAIGYKEFYPYFKNEKELSECVEVLKMNSRRYAKRQITWFKKNEEIKWLYPETDTDIYQEAILLAEEFLKK